jgi:hypothetical protein
MGALHHTAHENEDAVTSMAFPYCLPFELTDFHAFGPLYKRSMHFFSLK